MSRSHLELAGHFLQPGIRRPLGTHIYLLAVWQLFCTARSDSDVTSRMAWLMLFHVPYRWKAAQEGGAASAVADLSLKDRHGEPIEKQLPGGKVKKKAKNEVVLETNTRSKKKCVTTILGAPSHPSSPELKQSCTWSSH
jgi:hypothetical protein